jgi:ribosomal-protein-alanine N-acetyltransferase
VISNKRSKRLASGRVDLWLDYWVQSLMPKELQALIRFGFEEMDLNRIEPTTQTGNKRSQRVLAKLGFQIEG